MGRFKASPKTYALIFDEGQFEGLEVKCKPATVGQVLEVAELEAATGGALASNPAATGQVIDLLADVIVWWNLDDEDDTPIPNTAAGLRSQDPELVGAIVRAWVSAVSRAPRPLPDTSPPGEMEGSIPMESLPENQPGTAVPA